MKRESFSGERMTHTSLMRLAGELCVRSFPIAVTVFLPLVVFRSELIGRFSGIPAAGESNNNAHANWECVSAAGAPTDSGERSGLSSGDIGVRAGHTNPTRQRGECRRNFSRWRVGLVSAGVPQDLAVKCALLRDVLDAVATFLGVVVSIPKMRRVRNSKCSLNGHIKCYK